MSLTDAQVRALRVLCDRSAYVSTWTAMSSPSHSGSGAVHHRAVRVLIDKGLAAVDDLFAYATEDGRRVLADLDAGGRG
ncbi:MAG: hypothetical protein M0P31_14010 [Solirubrobacteraceae bacterium]|nr:hypothetical protein [Solirubrobacteraceae bacterium]